MERQSLPPAPNGLLTGKLSKITPRLSRACRRRFVTSVEVDRENDRSDDRSEECFKEFSWTSSRPGFTVKPGLKM